MPSLKSTWRRLLKKPLVLYAISFSVIGGFLIISSFASSSYKVEDFNSDPGWIGKANIDNSPACATRTSNFGWSATNKVNGAQTPTGEIGGIIPDNAQEQSWYAKKLSTPRTLDDRLFAAGSFIVPEANEDSAIYFGWFNTNSTDWRTNNFMALRITDGYSADKPNNSVFVDFATKSSLSGAVRLTRVNEAGQTVTAVLRPNQKMTWSLEYLPTLGTYGTYKISINSPLGNSSTEFPLTKMQRDDGATFDHFGFFGWQAGSTTAKTGYVDDLTINTGTGGANETFNFASDPGWEGKNNRTTLSSCWIRYRDNYGYSQTNHAGGSRGEVGGLMWNGDGGGASFLADRVGPLNFATDTLYATGRIVVNHVHSDTDIPYIGWFKQSTVNAEDITGLKLQNVVGIRVGGTSRVGHNLEPVYFNNEKSGRHFPEINSVEPKTIAREFWVCYVPNGDSAGNGRLTVGMLPVPSAGIAQKSVSVVVKASDKSAATTFDRFGFISPNIGGALATEFFLDNLRYTVGPGDTGPASHCGAPPSGNKTGDIDKDGQVNGRDVSILLANFGKTGTTSDLDNSGRVDGRDVSILLANFGK